jgi:hypothetical protein
MRILLRPRVSNGRWTKTWTTGKIAVIESGVSKKHGIEQ